jgi:hypothetical protein
MLNISSNGFNDAMQVTSLGLKQQSGASDGIRSSASSQNQISKKLPPIRMVGVSNELDSSRIPQMVTQIDVRIADTLRSERSSLIRKGTCHLRDRLQQDAKTQFSLEVGFTTDQRLRLTIHGYIELTQNVLIDKAPSRVPARNHSIIEEKVISPITGIKMYRQGINMTHKLHRKTKH